MNATTKTAKSEKASNGVNMETSIYNAQGKKTGTLELPENIFNVPWNESLMYQVVTSMQSNARTPVAHTKFRGDVRGGGKKPWQQKGTGRARHGSIRSPIWKGGGVTHGPRKEKNYARAIPKKMRAKAVFMALSQKLRDNELIFIDSFGLKAPKTAEAKKTLIALSRAGFEKLGAKKKNAALIALPENAMPTRKSFQNIGSVTCIAARDLNPVSVLGNTYLIIEDPKSAVATIAARAKNKADTK